MPTEIAWTDETWNPVTGCTRISDACAHCYIERTPPMRMAGRRFDGPEEPGSTATPAGSQPAAPSPSWADLPLALTGANTAAVAGLGAGLLLMGMGLLVVRRRRTRFVA